MTPDMLSEVRNLDRTKTRRCSAFVDSDELVGKQNNRASETSARLDMHRHGDFPVFSVGVSTAHALSTNPRMGVDVLFEHVSVQSKRASSSLCGGHDPSRWHRKSCNEIAVMVMAESYMQIKVSVYLVPRGKDQCIGGTLICLWGT